MSTTKILSFVKLLKLEPYLFASSFAGSISSVTTGLLLQDKLCSITYDQTTKFCIDLNSITVENDPNGVKDKILAASAQFGLYSMLLTTIPAVLWSLFAGSWTDKYIHGRKILLCLAALGGIVTSILQILNAVYFTWSPYFIILNALPSALTGGFMAALMAIYSYISVTTPEDLRSIRYSFVQLCTSVGTPLGTFIGGLLLRNTPNDSTGRLHNYFTIFSVTLIIQIVCFIYLILVINEAKQSVDERLPLLVNEINANSVIADNHNNNEEEVEVTINESEEQCSSSFAQQNQKPDNRWYYPIKLLFDTQNIKEVWICCTKYRENHRRKQLWIMIVAIFFMSVAMVGVLQVMFQFSEKVYRWSATFYSDVYSVQSIINTIIMVTVVPLFVIRWKLSDTNLAIIGLTSWIFRAIIIGSVHSPIGYFISIISIHGLTTIAIQSMLSKLVDQNELGKVFSLLSVLESVMPILSSLFFTFLWKWSINFFPGLVFEVSAALMIIPLVSVMWIELVYSQTTDP